MLNLPVVNGVHIKSWCNELEKGAEDQAINLALMPFAHHHIALMPDTHFGYGMPIGGVLAAKGVVIPNAVGVDIGCGMCAVRTNLIEINRDVLKRIMGEIRKVVPVGMNWHKDLQEGQLMPKLKDIGMFLGYPVVFEKYDHARKQLGTLGGGNHFIEIQKGDDGYIWIMIHSGSRNLGKQVADYYNKLAIKLNAKWHSLVPIKYELAFLPLDTVEAKNYIREMEYCVEYALANRKLMMQRILSVIKTQCSDLIHNFDTMINIAHNYATMEHHFGIDVMLHRKGATLARKGTIGIIPGSQGTKSYIVKGKGNSDSFDSCSHGAGRRMGRKEATRRLNLVDEIKKLDDQGIIHGIRNQKDLDEAPSAYKDINVVMKEQEDLVEILTELTPLAVIKG